MSSPPTLLIALATAVFLYVALKILFRYFGPARRQAWGIRFSRGFRTWKPVDAGTVDSERESTETISVAMCTFNGDRFLADQLGSLAAQSRLPDELVVCDDGSTDRTLATLRAFADTAPFPVRIVENHRRLGPTKNFEKAISLCTGTLIALADQDDVWHPDKLARQEHLLLSSHAVAVFTDAEVVDADLRSLGYRLWEAIRFSDAEKEAVRRGDAAALFLQRDVVTGCTLLFRAEHRSAILPISDAWIHDAWIALVLACRGRLAFLDEPVVWHRQHANNAVGAPDRASWLVHTFRRVFQLWNAPSEDFEREVERYRHIHGRMRSLASSGTDRTLLAHFQGKVDHLLTRVALPSHRLRRVPGIAGELSSGRYHRYSRGVQGLAKDLLRR